MGMSWATAAPSVCRRAATCRRSIIYEVGVRAYTDTVPFDFLEFAVTIWDDPYRAGQYPPEFDIYIDSNADGTDDYVIFNGDLTLNASDGRNVVFLVDLNVGVAQPWYFIDATFNSQNFILPMDAASIGVTPGQPFRFSVFAFDAYFTAICGTVRPRWQCLAPAPTSTRRARTLQRAGGAALPDRAGRRAVEAFSWTTSAAARMASPDADRPALHAPQRACRARVRSYRVRRHLSADHQEVG
jgi:hypothetical protein